MVAVAGAVIGVLAISYFVKILPGPAVSALIIPTKITGGNAKGCIAYHVIVSSDQPLNYIEFVIQIPGNVSQQAIGIAPMAQFANGPMHLDATMLGASASGDCAIHGLAGYPNDDVNTHQVGPGMVEVKVDHLAANLQVDGYVLESRLKPSFSPVIPTYTTGWYEYNRLGQTLTKAFNFQIDGFVQD